MNNNKPGNIRIKSNAPTKGLGMGLSALFGTDQYKFSNVNNTSPSTLKIEEIEPNSNQPRKHFDHESLIELSDSIKAHGVLQPILVRKFNGKYKIVAGERRYRAAKMANLSSIPAIILGSEITDQMAMEIAILENIQRKDLTPIEEASAYQDLITLHNYTHESLAKSIGKSRSHITNMLRILHLPESVLHCIHEGKISTGHAKILLSSNNPEELSNQIIENDLSIRELHDMINNENRDHILQKSETNQNVIQAINKDLIKLMNNIANTMSIHINKNVKINLDKKNRLIVKIDCHDGNVTDILDIITKNIT